VNPRTKVPYKRPGGAYKQQPAAEAVLNAALAAEKTANKKAADKETIADLRGQIATLQAELKAEKDSKELAVNAAKLEVQEKLAMSMLNRYQQGLRDGASLATGNGIGGSPAYGFGQQASAAGSPFE
jgi:hypothetical protein